MTSCATGWRGMSYLSDSDSRDTTFPHPGSIIPGRSNGPIGCTRPGVEPPCLPAVRGARGRAILVLEPRTRLGQVHANPDPPVQATARPGTAVKRRPGRTLRTAGDEARVGCTPRARAAAGTAGRDREVSMRHAPKAESSTSGFARGCGCRTGHVLTFRAPRTAHAHSHRRRAGRSARGTMRIHAWHQVLVPGLARPARVRFDVHDAVRDGLRVSKRRGAADARKRSGQIPGVGEGGSRGDPGDRKRRLGTRGWTEVADPGPAGPGRATARRSASWSSSSSGPCTRSACGGWATRARRSS